MRIFIYPYKQGSKSAKALAEAMGVKVIRRENSKYRYREGDQIINWGSSRTPYDDDGVFSINEGGLVDMAKNKLATFEELERGGVNIPPFTTSRIEAKEWLLAGAMVVGRKILNGHSGAGIELYKPDEVADVGNCPLYTKYVSKWYEYRVHCTRLGVFDIVKKTKRNDAEVIDPYIRSHEKGWVFIREFEHIPDPQVSEQALLALDALGLDFGAVDVVWSARKEKAYVLEVNTAPGLEGQTVEKYAEALKGLIHG